ncbi:hypothetical protein HN789_06780 [archaeon]|jgi:hypothetical protein|nr:hypothetical protein [archaeon]MBT4022730.1 hypothetical protein [archaeon]MBT4273076.1 hypothetical protein [archaeon]MBT4461057.1 hypothetical protein [archaeon]MBT4858726.1 hypothetical protein [archaeon]
MKKRAQVTIYIIISLVFVFLLAFYFLTQKDIQDGSLDVAQETMQTSQMNVDTKSYIRNCIDLTLQKHMADTGLSDSTKEEYEIYVEDGVVECIDGLFSKLRDQTYEVSTGEIKARIELNEETIIVEINYPITLKKDNSKVEYDSFLETFKKTAWVEFPGGAIEEDTVVFSSDKRAYIVLPAGVKMKDQNGQPIEKMGIKVRDKHFDGLENGVVIGNLVFEGLPDGLQFSQPVEMAVEFRPQDIPEGINLEDLAFVEYDPEHFMWRGVPTRIEDNRMIGMIKHFSPPKGAGICDIGYDLPPGLNTLDMVFMHRYADTNNIFTANHMFLISDESETMGAIEPFENGNYYDYLSRFPGSTIRWGHNTVNFEEGQYSLTFEDCMMEEKCNDGTHFTIPVDGTLVEKCDICGDSDCPTNIETVTHNPCGTSNSHWQSLGLKDFEIIENEGTLDEKTITVSKRVCECKAKTEGETKSFGYCKKSCVSGQRMGGTYSSPVAIHCVEVEGNGNGCAIQYDVEAVYPKGDYCSFQRISGSDILEIPDPARGVNQLCVVGVHYSNNNNDAEGYCGPRYFVNGYNVDYWARKYDLLMI